MNKTRGLFYEVGGVFYQDLAEAQKADLLKLFDTYTGTSKETMAEWLLENAKPLVAILTTTPRSRVRKTRKDKGVPRVKRQDMQP